MLEEKTRRKFKTETKRRQLLTFCFFSGPTLRRSPVVAHEEEKTTINQNLLTKKEQAKESELGLEEMRKRGEKTIDTNLLSSPALPVDCCVFDTHLPWRKGRTLTKSAPTPWLSSRYRDFAKRNTGTRFCETRRRLTFAPIQGIAWGRGRCV